MFSKEEHICSFSRFKTEKEEHARPQFGWRVPNPAGAFLFLQIFSKEEHICSFSRFRTAKEEHARP
jgi:hypothetical protein